MASFYAQKKKTRNCEGEYVQHTIDDGRLIIGLNLSYNSVFLINSRYSRSFSDILLTSNMKHIV